MTRLIDSVLIVGSGFAAWASAAMLARATAGRMTVSVVPTDPGADDSIDDLMGSSRPEILAAHRALDIDEPGFMRASDATFKLATELRNWGSQRESYLHAFGDIGARLNSVPFHQLLNRLRLARTPIPRPEECSLAAAAARSGRFSHPGTDQRSVHATYDYAYQFDVSGATAHLRALAARLGVRQLAGHVAEVRVREDGFLQGVTLAHGERVDAKFFLDCSGAQSRLMGQALEVPFEGWSRWLPCDRVVYLRAPRTGDPAPLTRASAHPAGWHLTLPLRSQDIHGMFYASGHCTDERAANELETTLPQPCEKRVSAFASGRRRRFWQGNCVAIGAAGGVVDPIGSTSVQLIYNAIARLISLFPYEDGNSAVIQQYERLTVAEHERARDFAALLYCTSRRDDSPFWRELRATALPDVLRYRLDLFSHGGHLAVFDDEIFEESDWISVLLGQGLWPQHADPLTLSMDLGELARTVNRMREVMSRAAEAMPPHQRYLDKLGLGRSEPPVTQPK